jgi:ribosomal protein S18 acetylase RimI-like enzyme
MHQPLSLARRAFTEADWEDVQGFDCGSERYESEVADWLKGSIDKDSALAAINDKVRPTSVWLYRLGDQIVGFGALSISEWRWKRKKDPRIPLTLIIWVGLHKDFQGLPKDVPREERYSSLILEDLIIESKKDEVVRPALGLVVHSDNFRAIKLYERFGFTQGFEPYKDKTTGNTYIRMAVALDPEGIAKLTKNT